MPSPAVFRVARKGHEETDKEVHFSGKKANWSELCECDGQVLEMATTFGDGQSLVDNLVSTASSALSAFSSAVTAAFVSVKSDAGQVLKIGKQECQLPGLLVFLEGDNASPIKVLKRFKDADLPPETKMDIGMQMAQAVCLPSRRPLAAHLNECECPVLGTCVFLACDRISSLQPEFLEGFGWIDRFIEAYAMLGKEIRGVCAKQGKENWKKAMHMQKPSCVAIYAAACLCLEPNEISEMTGALKGCYEPGLLENPEAVCQLRRILKCPGLEEELQNRPKLNFGIRQCLATPKERYHLGFAMGVFPRVRGEPEMSFCLLKEVWHSFRIVAELGGVSSAQAEEEAYKTLEESVSYFKWNMQGVNLSKELREAPFLGSDVLVQTLLDCHGSDQIAKSYQLAAANEHLKEKVDSSLVKLVAERLQQISEKTARQALDTLNIMKETGNHVMLDSILKAEFKIQGARRLDTSLQFLDEAASLLSMIGNPKELENSLDHQTDQLLMTASDQHQIFELLKEGDLPEKLYASVLAVLGARAHRQPSPQPIDHSRTIGSTESDLEVLVESIGRGICKEAKWLDSIRGEEACSLKRLGQKIHGMKGERPSQVELQFALELGREDTVGWKFMTFFDMDLKAHASAVEDTKKIQKAVEVMRYQLSELKINLSLEVPGTFPACASWSCIGATRDGQHLLQGISELNGRSSILKSCLREAAKAAHESFASFIDSAAKIVCAWLQKIHEGHITHQDKLECQWSSVLQEPPRLMKLARCLRFDHVQEERLRENLQCLCVPLSDHKKRCEALLRILKAKKGQEEDRKRLQQLEEDFAKAEKSTPVIAGDGKPCLRKLQERMSDLMGIPLDKVADLHWEQLDQLHEVHLFASQVLDKPTADIDRSLEALQTRCVSHPQMIVPVTELREFVNLLRRSANSQPLRQIGKLLSEKIPAHLDREKRNEFTKLLCSSGLPDISEKGRFCNEELTSKDTFLKVQVQDCKVFKVARVHLHLCPEANSIAHDGQLFGNKLQAFIAELFDVGAKWTTLKAEDDKETQEAKKFLKRLQQLKERVAELSQLEGLINKLLHRGWELPCEAERLAIAPDGDSDLTSCGLDSGSLSQLLRGLDNDRRDHWDQEPVSSWVNLQLRKSQVDIKYVEQVLGQLRPVAGDESESESDCLQSWSGPTFLQISGAPGLQAISMVLAPSAGGAAHFTRQILTCLNFCRLDALFACHKHSCPLAVEGMLWRIRERHQVSPVLVLALPEILPIESQEEIQRQLADCRRALQESGKFLVIVVADDKSKMFHRLTDFRRPDIEAVAKSLSDEQLQKVCPFQDVQLLEGKPLSGKSSSLSSHPSNRLALRPDLSELEFCRLCRRICRDGQAPELVLDFGWTEIDGKLSSCGMLLLPLLLFGVAGLSLTCPFCINSPREHGVKKRLVLEVGPADRIGLFSSLRSKDQGPDRPSIPAEPVPEWFLHLQQLAELKSQAEEWGVPVAIYESEVESALQTDFEGNHKQLVHPYTHTLVSLREMLRIMNLVVVWRKQTAHAPIIVLLGETGTGKTYLLTKTFELYGRFVEQVDRRVLSLSQAINPYRLMEWVRDLVKERKPKTLTVVILDEVNATDAVEVCKQLLVDRTYEDDKGQNMSLPRDILFTATGNPKESEVTQYDVFDLPPSLEQRGQYLKTLQPESTHAFLRAHNCHADGDGWFCDALIACQKAVSERLGVATSLRDAMRCCKFHQQLMNLNTHYTKEPQQKALKEFSTNASALALYLCYGLQLPREDFWKLDIFQHHSRKNFREQVHKVRNYVFESHKPPSWVVQSEQLEDNLLLLTVAFAASFKDLYLHLLLLGNEGAAKTLSITLFLAAAKGQFANSDLFKALPSAQTVRIQLSSATTAAHLRDVADTAQEFAKTQQASLTHANRVVVVMEELGMASHLQEKPLKALHHLMDLHVLEKSTNSFLFVGTANFTSGECPLDAALMNRLLVLRSERLNQQRLLELCHGVSTAALSKNSDEKVDHKVDRKVDENLEKVVRQFYGMSQHDRFVRDIIAFSSMDPKVFYATEGSLPYWLHFQAPRVKETQAILKSLGVWSARQHRPTLSMCLKETFGVLEPDAKPLNRGRRTRHALITVRSPAGLHSALCAVSEARSPNQEVVVCRQESGQCKEDCNLTLQLTQVALALEHGHLLVLLFPRQLLDALHAVLNADYARSELSASTLSYNAIHRDVIVKAEAKIVIIMEESEAASLHPAVLSRVSILHSALLNDTSRSQRLHFKSPWEELKGAKTIDQAQASLKRLRDGLPSVEEALEKAEEPTVAVAISTAFPRRECVQLSLLDGPQDLARKLRESDQLLILILDLHGLSQTEFLNYSLTLSLGGGFSKELGWCKSLSPKASKMPRKILLLMPPYLAHRLETAEGGHVVREWWLDDATDSSAAKADLSSLLQVEHLWSLVRPICEEMVRGFNGASGALSTERWQFAVDLLSEALKRAMPLLNPDDAARVLAMRQLAQRKVELGSFRSLVESVACSSTRHAACRFWPWLQRCLFSDFSATAVGREILLKSVRMAPLSFMDRLQPAGEMEQVLLQCPKQLRDSPGPETVLFPFVEELVAIVNRVAEHSWGHVGARHLAEKLRRNWPNLLHPENVCENTQVLWSCLADQLPERCQQVPQVYLESIRKETSDAEALIEVCTKQAVLDALSFVEGDPPASFEYGPAEVLFDACKRNSYSCSLESLFALREASRRLNHPELSQLSALWWAFIQLSHSSVDYAWHRAQALFDQDATVEQNHEIEISIPLVLGLAQCLPRTRNIFPLLVNCHPEAAAFLVARILPASSPDDARSQLRALRDWLQRTMEGAAWSSEYLESSYAKFAVNLMSSWLKGMNLEKWLRSFRSADLFGSAEAAETLSVLAAALHIVPKLAQNWDCSAAGRSALQKMAGVHGLRRPIESYFIRLLAHYHGEDLTRLASSLEPLGEWIHPFIKAPPSEADREVVRQLMFLPQFAQLLEVSGSWAHVLREALELELTEDALRQVKAVANVVELGPLTAAAAIWMALLISASSTSAFAAACFNPSVVAKYVLPLQQPDEVGTHQIAGATRQYQCSSCGEPYFIGECGQAMQMARCPSCGGNIGGQSHQLSNPNDARLTRRQVRGMGHFEEGTNYTLRAFDHHMYRLVQLQLLLPLAVKEPRMYSKDLHKNLSALCGQLEVRDGQGALLMAKVFYRFGRKLLLPGIRFSNEDAPARQAEEQLRYILRKEIASPDALKRLLNETEAELEAAGHQLLPIERLRESELEKLPSDERRDEFANELLKLPSKDVWDSWNKLSDDEKAKLPLAGLFITDDWKEQARVLQQIPNLVVGWCHLHSFVYHHGKKGRETVLASCGMDEGVLAKFIRSWNSLVQQRIGYECQRDLQLVEISPESQAELPLLEKGSMGGALFTTLVDLHNKILKQVCPALEESTPTVQLFKERNSTKTVLLDLQHLYEVRECFIATCSRSSEPFWHRCDELLVAAVHLHGPKLLAQTWPSLVAVDEVVKVRYNQLDASVVETSIHAESQLDGLDELKNAEPKLLADMLAWCQQLALHGEEHIARDHPLLELLPLPKEARGAEELLRKLKLTWQHLEGFQQFLASMVTSPCLQLDPQLQQPLHDELDRQMKAALKGLPASNLSELLEALKLVAAAVGYQQKDHKLHAWLGGVDLEEDTLKVVPMEALVANLGDVLGIVHRQIVEAKQTEEDDEL